jgi:peptide methionine sulfoxide reductase msrA/msrB
VRQVPDTDGRRTEILCARCGGHLVHVFRGEGFTPRDTRHCVNSISIDFVPARAQGAPAAVPGSDPAPAGTTEAEAFFAGGCFWGVEHLLAQQPGVLRAESGYMGGHTQNPTYEQVCSGTTGHLETVRVVYDPRQVSYEQLVKLFFEIHDPTQVDRQGPDVGPQYGSAIFYTSAPERQTAEALAQRLRQQGLKVATRILPAGVFWRAEAYHQDYYARTGKQPYCHARVKRFP